MLARSFSKIILDCNGKNLSLVILEVCELTWQENKNEQVQPRSIVQEASHFAVTSGAQSAILGPFRCVEP